MFPVALLMSVSMDHMGYDRDRLRQEG